MYLFKRLNKTAAAKANIFLLFFICLVSCNGVTKKDMDNYSKGSFRYDLAFLKKYDSVIVLSSGMSKIIVSPKYQGKIFTSTASGDEGTGFGWINYNAFDSPADPHMNAYGGENRLWIGPEGGRYALFFETGDSMVFNNWKTPAAIDTEPWEVKDHRATSVVVTKDMHLRNYAGAYLSMRIEREINILHKKEIASALSVEFDDNVQYVGYSTTNTLMNTGKTAWTEETGMPCIWILDMFKPSDNTTIVIPHKQNEGNGKIATTDYFGEIPGDRIRHTTNALFFKADGKSRGKLGIVPSKALPIAGSYDAAGNMLTITKFTVDSSAKYLNQEWNTVKDVFSGDAMNVYNDGPLADGKQMGPFYEIESVSPAAVLNAGESLTHKHDVYHFTGDTSQLNAIAEKLLGVSLEEIKKIF